MGVNSLPKAVTRQRRDYDLSPGPSASESNTLTTPLLALGGDRFNCLFKSTVKSPTDPYLWCE